MATAPKRSGSMKAAEASAPVEEPEKIEEPEEENLAEPDAPDVEEDEDDLAEDNLTLESLDPDEELWPGGPKVAQVIAWKEEHGEVWVTTLNPYTNRHVLWRPLNRHEYRGMVTALEQAIANGASNAVATMDNEEVVAETVILFPKYNRHDRRGTLAGMPQTISQEVMEMSGFTAVEVRQL